MRLAAKTDSNHAEIVKAFRAYGYSVLDISRLKNCCDLFVAKKRRTFAVEIKDGSKPPSKRQLTDGELKFMSEWKGVYIVIESLSDVTAFVNYWK